MGAQGDFLASLISAPIPRHLHPAFTPESPRVGVMSGEGGVMSGQLAAAGWARRGQAALRLEVRGGGRTLARLQRRLLVACVRALLVCSGSVLCTARVTVITSRAEADRGLL